MKHILAISGSTRKESVNDALLDYIAEKYKSIIELTKFDSIEKLPQFNPDLEQTNLPESVYKFRKLISESDAVLICTPEYVFSLPGSLKNAIDWNVSTTVFSGKPTGLIVASAVGKHAYQSLILILSTIEAKLTEKTSCLLNGIKGKFKNNHFEDSDAEKQVDILIHELIKL